MIAISWTETRGQWREKLCGADELFDDFKLFNTHRVNMEAYKYNRTCYIPKLNLSWKSLQKDVRPLKCLLLHLNERTRILIHIMYKQLYSYTENMKYKNKE